MVLPPFAERLKNRSQSFTVICQRILDLWRHLLKNFTLHNIVTLEFTQLLGEHFLRDVRHELAQFAEAPRFQHQIAGDNRFPFAANDIEGGADCTCFRFHGFRKVTSAQISAYLPNSHHALRWLRSIN
jgi:hypothetical protein